MAEGNTVLAPRVCPLPSSRPDRLWQSRAHSHAFTAPCCMDACMGSQSGRAKLQLSFRFDWSAPCTNAGHPTALLRSASPINHIVAALAEFHVVACWRCAGWGHIWHFPHRTVGIAVVHEHALPGAGYDPCANCRAASYSQWMASQGGFSHNKPRPLG